MTQIDIYIGVLEGERNMTDKYTATTHCTALVFSYHFILIFILFDYKQKKSNIKTCSYRSDCWTLIRFFR